MMPPVMPMNPNEPLPDSEHTAKMYEEQVKIYQQMYMQQYQQYVRMYGGYSPLNPMYNHSLYANSSAAQNTSLGLPGAPPLT